MNNRVEILTVSLGMAIYISVVIYIITLMIVPNEPEIEYEEIELLETPKDFSITVHKVDGGLVIGDPAIVEVQEGEIWYPVTAPPPPSFLED